MDIPVIDATAFLEPALATLETERGRLNLLLGSAARTYTRPGLVLADWRTRVWTRGLQSPYVDEVRSVEHALGRAGAHLLNYAYEWGCTTGACPDDALGGMTMLRTLDWPFDGLGQAMIVARQRGAAGSYLTVTWPGFVGVMTAMAPGRFAAAINQPPLPLPHLGRAAGWLMNRVRAGRSRAIPPDHLLRLAFDTCDTFEDAVALIRATPICLPAIITVAGSGPGQHCTIERTQHQAFDPGTSAAANHWEAAGSPAGRPRNVSSHERQRTLEAHMAATPDWSLGWLQPPVLQPDTRLVMMANPRSGRLVVQGWESTGPVTTVLDMVEAPTEAS